MFVLLPLHFNIPQTVDIDYVCITAITFNMLQIVDIDYVCIIVIRFNMPH
jgi:hypothetical protein